MRGGPANAAALASARPCPEEIWCDPEAPVGPAGPRAASIGAKDSESPMPAREA